MTGRSVAAAAAAAAFHMAIVSVSVTEGDADDYDFDFRLDWNLSSFRPPLTFDDCDCDPSDSASDSVGEQC